MSLIVPRSETCLVNNNQSFTLDFFDITDPANITRLKSIDLADGSFSSLVVYNNIAHLFGTNFNSGQAVTSILKFPVN